MSDREDRHAAVLEGWDLEPLPGGITRMTKSDHQDRGCSVAVGLVIALGGGLIALFTLTGEFEPPGTSGFWYRLMAGLLLLLAALAFAWMASGTEEWYVSDNLLEIRHTLGKYPWTERYTGATLKIRWVDQEASRSWHLELEAHGRKRELDRGEQGATVIVGRPFAPSDIHALGRFLSERTGWPLRVPSELQESQS